MSSNQASKPRAMLWPRFLRKAWPRARPRPPAQAAAAASELDPLHLVLLAQAPDGSNTGRPFDAAVADILASASFRDRVLLPLLLELPIPQQQLGRAELAAARAWMTGIGAPPAGIEADGVELFATLILSEPVQRLAAATLPAYAARVQQLARRLLVRSSGRLPLTEQDVEALYLLLLGRRPESDVVYRDRAGRPRGQMIAEVLGSIEFREKVLPVLLADSPSPAAGPGPAELSPVRNWVATRGATLATPAPDWIGLISAFLSDEPARSLVQEALPADGERLLRRVAREAARSPEERAEREQARRLRAEIDGFERRLKELEAGWRQHVPAFLNAVSSVGAFAHRQAQLQRDLEALRGKLDTARKAAE